MRSLRFHGQKDIRLDELEEPTVVEKGQVKIKPVFSGICGSDLTEYLVGPLVSQGKTPVTLGHEFSALVEEVSPEIKDLVVGDRVAVYPLESDSTCDACQRGRPNCCKNFGTIGYTTKLGGFSEHLVVDRGHLYKLPDNVSLEEGALAEPLSVAWHAVTIGTFQPGDNTLVIGAGPVGIGLIQVLKARGAGKVIVTELSPGRKNIAEQFGADYVLDPSKSDIAAKIMEICDGVGPSVVFDAAGVQPGLDLALGVCRTGGTVVNVAIWKTQPQVNAVALIMGEKKLVGTMVFLKEDYEQVLDAMGKGILKPGKMVTKIIRLEETLEKGIHSLLESKDTDVKILVEV